jgi:hypothetical protein
MINSTTQNSETQMRKTFIQLFINTDEGIAA